MLFAREKGKGHAALALQLQVLVQLQRLFSRSRSMPTPYQGSMQSCALSLHYDDASEGKRVFDALGSGGKVTMPFEKTFWADGFGMLTDRFGVARMVNCGQIQ
jgi:PhnB protein